MIEPFVIMGYFALDQSKHDVGKPRHKAQLLLRNQANRIIKKMSNQGVDFGEDYQKAIGDPLFIEHLFQLTH